MKLPNSRGIGNAITRCDAGAHLAFHSDEGDYDTDLDRRHQPGNSGDCVSHAPVDWFAGGFGRFETLLAGPVAFHSFYMSSNLILP
jgi:hypothetical protein